MSGAGRKRWILSSVGALVVGCLVAMGMYQNSPAPLEFGKANYFESKGKVRAWVSVTNLTGVNLLLWGGHGWARIEGPRGWVTNRLENPELLTSVRPGSNFVERLEIASGTKQWQVGYFVPTQSAQEKARMANGWRREVFLSLGHLLSDKKPPPEEFWSEIFIVPADRRGTPELNAR